MKVHGSMYSSGLRTDAHKNALYKQNGKKSRAIRAAVLKGQGIKRSQRRLNASR